MAAEAAVAAEGLLMVIVVDGPANATVTDSHGRMVGPGLASIPGAQYFANPGAPLVPPAHLPRIGRRGRRGREGRTRGDILAGHAAELARKDLPGCLNLVEAAWQVSIRARAY